MATKPCPRGFAVSLVKPGRGPKPSHPKYSPGTGQNPTIALFARIDKLREIGPAIEPGSLRGDEPRPASLCGRLEASQPETWWSGRSYRLGRGCNQTGW